MTDTADLPYFNDVPAWRTLIYAAGEDRAARAAVVRAWALSAGATPDEDDALRLPPELHGSDLADTLWVHGLLGGARVLKPLSVPLGAAS